MTYTVKLGKGKGEVGEVGEVDGVVGDEWMMKIFRVGVNQNHLFTQVQHHHDCRIATGTHFGLAKRLKMLTTPFK